jgi:hypothetical protein
MKSFDRMTKPAQVAMKKKIIKLGKCDARLEVRIFAGDQFWCDGRKSLEFRVNL